MSDAAHTAGPWRLSTDDRGFVTIRTGERNEHPDSDLVASICANDADGPLLCAAPDLLSALGQLLVIAGTPITARQEAIFDAARAAIAKARTPSQAS